MLKKKMHQFFSVLVVLGILSISVSQAADYRLLGYRLNGGVGNYGYSNRYFFITSSASGQTTRILEAMKDWIYTTDRLGVTTPVSYKRTTVQKNSVMDFYMTTDNTMDANAWTEAMSNGKRVNARAQNWGWNKITINYARIGYLQLTTTTARKGSIAHEIGHCFGLDENNTRTDVIMCQYGYGRTATAATTRDLKGINILY